VDKIALGEDIALRDGHFAGDGGAGTREERRQVVDRRAGLAAFSHLGLTARADSSIVSPARKWPEREKSGHGGSVLSRPWILL